MPPYLGGAVSDRPTGAASLQQGRAIQSPGLALFGDPVTHTPTVVLLLMLLAADAFASPAPMRHDFDEANALKDGDACDEAVVRYEQLLDRLPEDSALRGAARYNQAVCLEEMGLADAALEAHAQVAQDPSATRLILRDAQFRIALIHVARGDDRLAWKALMGLLRESQSPERDVISVHLAALAARAVRRRRAAKRLTLAVPVLEAAHDVDDRLGLDTHMAVASLTMGDLVAGDALRTPLRGSSEDLRAALDRIAVTVEAAQAHYVDAMRRGDPTWAAAASLHLGELFVTFHGRLFVLRQRLQRRPPPRSSKAEALALDIWLGQRGEPLLLQARQLLRLCADMPREVGAPNRFTERCAERLDEPPL